MRVPRVDTPSSTWPHLVVLVVAFVSLFAASWATWPDPLIDFGRELYAPWQISQGAVLTRDVAWFYGPLSQYWNAALFSVFGVGLTTLVWANAALFTLILVLLHSLLRSFSSDIAATLACLVVMATCGFGRLVGIGNYNYITPYSHEMTHGVLLGLAALAALQRWRTHGRDAWIVASGVCVGLTFLTKPEIFAAALIGAGVALAGHTRSAAVGTAHVGARFAVGLVAPIGATWALLAQPLGAADAALATLAAVRPFLSSRVISSPFYQAVLGTDAPMRNTLLMLVSAAAVALVGGAGAAVAAWPQPRQARLARIAIIATVAAVVWIPWFGLVRSWPLLVLSVLVCSLWRTMGDRGSARWPMAAGFAAFALGMLGRMALNARIPHYGFVLAMPATALLVAVSWSWVPEGLRARGLVPRAYVSVLATVLSLFVGVHALLWSNVHAALQTPVGVGHDRFIADHRGPAIAETLAWIAQRYPPGTPRPTLVVFPEGAMVNYLARSRNPTPYLQFIPPTLAYFGESRMLASLQRHPPDLVAVAHVDAAEYGARWFGRDYAVDIGAWLRTNYETTRIVGDRPMQPGSRFGIEILARRRP
jgi:hypothetical protein